VAVPSIQTALSAGEISPELYGQVTLAKFAAAGTTIRNMFVGYRGGAVSRGGLAFTGVCLQTLMLAAGTSTGPPRPINFQFSITQGFNLELGDHYMRFVFQGGYVLEAPVAVASVSQANPGVFGVTGTPFADGDWVFATGFGGMTQLNGRTFIVQGVGSGSFTLTDLMGNVVNTSAFPAYTGGGAFERYYTITTPWAAVDLPYLKFYQTADVMSFACSNPISGNEYPPYDLTRVAATDWTLVQVDLSAAIAPPASASAAANAQAPSSGVNASFAYQVTAVDSKGNESVASITATCHGADLEVEAGTNTITWSQVSTAQFYNVYRAPASVDSGSTQIPVPAGSIFGFVGSAFGTQFADNQSVTDLTQTPPTHNDPFARGQILAVNISNTGSSVSTVTFTITTAGGTGFSGSPVVIAASLRAFLIQDNGENYQPGDTIAFNGAGFAGGAIKFGTTNPTAGDTITLNGVVWTFVTGTATGNQTSIQAALSATLSLLVSQLSASTNPALDVANYSADSSGDLIITYKTSGTAGNAYTLAASAATPTGATLTGGASSGVGNPPSATLTVGPETGTYPGVVAYFQQRRFYANSFNDPDTFWASQTALYSNFDVAIPTQATDAITASPWTEQVNGIQWLVPMPGGLIAMTGSRAWQIVGEGSYALNVQPITPSSTQAQPQAFNGCSATIQPVVVDYDVIYVEAVGATTVRDLSYNFFTSIYTGNDLTLLSSHLFLYQQLTYTTWCRKPYKVLWCSRDDGTFLSMTYLKEQEVYGWARHDTLGLVQGLTSVTEPPVNALYVVVQRFPPYAPQGIYTMERMDNRIWQSVEDTYAVDSGVSNPMTSPAVSVYASAASGAGVVFAAQGNAFSAGMVGQILRMGGGIAEITAFNSAKQVTGAWVLPAAAGAIGVPFSAAGDWTIAAQVTTLLAPHLAGMTVVGLGDGVPFEGVVVAADGTITLPFPASNVKAGLPFLPQFQTPYANGQQVAQGARKVVPAVTFRLAASGRFQYGTNQPDGAAQNPPQLGPTWTNLATCDPTQPTGGQAAATTYTSPGGQPVTQVWTGDLRVVGNGASWISKGQVAAQQPLPLPLEITAIMPESLEGDAPEETYEPKRDGGQGGQPRGPGLFMLGSARI
jgi:hypothetical protein